MSPISVAIFGKSALAINVAIWLQQSPQFDLIAVVPTKPHAPWCDDLGEWANDNNVPCVPTGRIDDLDAEPAMALCLSYNQIFKPHHLARFDYALNVHNSTLPLHRGMKPIDWSMMDGSHQQGVTMHKIEAGVDTGDIYGQVTFKTWPHQSSHDIHALCLQYAYPMVTSVLSNLDQIKPTPQDHTQATYHYGHEIPAAT